MQDIPILENLRENLVNWLKVISAGKGKYKFALHSLHPYSLDATSLAIDLKNMVGENIDSEKPALTQYLHESQSKKDGFFHESFESKFLSKDKSSRLIEMSATYLSFQVSGLLRLLKLEPKYEYSFYRKLLRPVDMDKYLNKTLPWEKSPWGAGGMIDSMATMLSVNIDSGYDEYIESFEEIFRWLEQNQDVETGLWGNISPQGDEGLVNGGYHVLRGTYIWHKRQFGRVRKIIDTLIKYISSSENFENNKGNGCNDLDAFFLLAECHKVEPKYRSDQIINLVHSRLDKLDVFKKDDGGFSFFPDRAEDEHNYYRVTESLSESDVQGSVFYLQTIISMCKILYPNRNIDFRSSFTHGSL